MKNTAIITIFTALILYSCQQNEVIDEVRLPTKEDVQAGIDNSANPQKALIINGTPYYVGIGYSPTRDISYPSAFEYDHWTVLEDAPSTPTEIKVEVIKTNAELEDFMRKSRSTSVDFLFKFIGFGSKSKKTIEETIRFSRETVTVIARVSVPYYQYLMDGDPVLNSRAQTLVDSGRMGYFLKRYGAMYIDTHTLGGEVYYLYSYNLTNISKERRSGFERNIKENIEGLFNIESENTLSAHDKEEIRSSIDKYTVVSNIPGYAPTLITEPSQLSDELANIQNYLTENPTLAASMEMTLKPYASVYDLADFVDLYNSEAKCHADWEEWNDLYSSMQYIYNNTTVTETKNAAQAALKAIDSQITNSSVCNNSTTPSGQEYVAIEQAYQKEVIDAELASVLRPVYVYGKGWTKYFRLSPDNNLVASANDVTFQWFATPYPGSIPLYEFHKPSEDTYSVPSETFYSTVLGRSENGLDSDFKPSGIVGYVFPTQVEGSIPLYRGRVRYSDNRPRIYHHTIQKGNFQEKKGDKDITIIGYVFPYLY